MAKSKMKWYQVALVALGVVVVAGSAASILKDKNDAKEEKHVHDFTTSNYCKCGERQEEILLKDVKAGMDLTGYDLQLAVSEAAFNEYITENSGFLPSNYTVIFENTYDSAGIQVNYQIDINLSQAKVPSENEDGYIRWTWDTSGVNDMGETPVEDFVGLVEGVSGDAEVGAYFKLVYVGESTTSAVSYNLLNTEAQTEEASNAVEGSSANETKTDWGTVTNALPDPSERWSEVY